MTRVRLWWISVAAMTVMACSDGNSGVVTPDANGMDDMPVITPDGPVTDNPVTPVDMGTPTDDGTPVDMGVPTDTGTPADMGAPVDNGMVTDSGMPMDAGVPDDVTMPVDVDSPDVMMPPTDAGMTGVRGHAGASLVSTGHVLQSAGFRMVSTLGATSPQQGTMRSTGFRLVGGLVGATGGR